MRIIVGDGVGVALPYLPLPKIGNPTWVGTASVDLTSSTGDST